MATAEKPSFVFGVDLDGVCADFYAEMRKIAADWMGVAVDSLPTEVSYGLTEWHLDTMGGYEPLHQFAVTQRELFRNILPISGAAQSLRRLSGLGVRIRIITHRLIIQNFHQVAVQQTVAWLDKYGIPYSDLTFMKDKSKVGADMYIDDSPENIEMLRASTQPDRVIVFGNSTNRHLSEPRVESWAEVEALVMNAKRKWDLLKAP
jgi:5'(3')-deoxyribonucleotidase